MKKRNLYKVAKHIEGLRAREFDMSNGSKCIAAHTYELATGEFPNYYPQTEEEARKFLGLTKQETQKLFRPSFHRAWRDKPGNELTNELRRTDTALAARVLRRAAKLGKIVWR